MSGGDREVGLTSIPLNPRHSTREQEYVLNNAEADALILSAEFIDPITPILSSVPTLKKVIVMGAKEENPGNAWPMKNWWRGSRSRPPRPEPADDHIDRIQYTSGTTGRPKGAVSTSSAFL